MVGSFPACCAPAVSGHETADPAINLMKSRRRIAAPKAQSLCGLCFGTTQLQQGFPPGGMGFDRHFAWQQSSGPNVRFGSKRTSRHLQPMSALPPKADVGTQSRNSLCANSGHSALRQGTSLFDHLVSALLELERNVDADCLCGLEVDHQFELDRGLDGKLARLCAP